MIEVLVALTILAVGILGVMAAFSLGTRTSSHNVRLAEAVAIAQRELELAVIVPTDSLTSSKGASEPYTWTVNYAQKMHGLVFASVAVCWTERGQGQVFRLSRIFLPLNMSSQDVDVERNKIK